MSASEEVVVAVIVAADKVVVVVVVVVAVVVVAVVEIDLEILLIAAILELIAAENYYTCRLKVLQVVVVGEEHSLRNLQPRILSKH